MIRRAKKMLFSMVICGAMLFVVPGFLIMAEGIDTWTFETIPNLSNETETTLGRVWAYDPNNLYVVTGKVPPGGPGANNSYLYRWNGSSWSIACTLPDHDIHEIFGTGPTDVFMAARTKATNPNFQVEIYHYNGSTCTQQILPSLFQGTTGSIWNIVGEPNNLYVAGQIGETVHLLRYDGTQHEGNDWYIVKDGWHGSILGYISSTEVHGAGCSTHYLWNESTQTMTPLGSNVGCDLWGNLWGMRDNQNTLYLYATGNTGFGYGVKIWRYIEGTTNNWSTVFSDPPTGVGIGSGWGIWGSGPNNIYVMGNRVGVEPTDGRVYHFDGIKWERVACFGNIPNPTGIWGSGSNDVWVGLSDRRLLHGLSSGSIAYSASGAGYNYPEPSFRASLSLDVSSLCLEGAWLKYSFKRMFLSSTSITGLSVTGGTATVTGVGKVNNVAGCSFTATVTDGSPDAMGIVISPGGACTTSYTAGSQVISSGNYVVVGE